MDHKHIEGVEGIEDSKLEFGPETNEMSWLQVQKELEKINSELPNGERPWRLPSDEELLAELDKTGSRDFCYWLDTGMIGGEGLMEEGVDLDGVLGDLKYIPHFKARFVR